MRRPPAVMVRPKEDVMPPKVAPPVKVEVAPVTDSWLVMARFVAVALVMFAILAISEFVKKLVDVAYVLEALVARSCVAKRLVAVAFVAVSVVIVPRVAKRSVLVLWVVVAFVAERF